MHELSVAESLMNITLEKAGAENADKVVSVTIVVGNLAGIVPDSLLYCFDTIKLGTIASEAILNIEEVKATADCIDCNKRIEIEQFDFACPDCGSVIIPTGGQELFVKDIEIE